MSPDIMQEVDFLLYTVVMGAAITCVYDMFRILRRVIRHNLIWISFEDLIFWIACAFYVFAVLYRENNGTLRWFAVIGAVCGMVVYRLTLGQFLVKLVSDVLLKVIHILEKIILFLLRPLAVVWKQSKSVGKKAGCKTKRVWHIAKNKLTYFKKVVRMIVYKQ